MPSPQPLDSLTRQAMNISLGVSFLLLVGKGVAYALTGSASILSDALESIVHVLAVGFAAWALRLSHRPADDTHPYGHSKVIFLSAGAEGAAIIMASVFILYKSMVLWKSHQMPENIDVGVMLSLVVFVLNSALGIWLYHMGKKKSLTLLKANGIHVLTDSITSLGVLVALGLVWFTGWAGWDPLVAILVALNLLIMGFFLMRRATKGLMDEVSPGIWSKILKTLHEASEKRNLNYHDVRARDLGDALWVDFHVLTPADMTVREAHHLASEIEAELNKAIPLKVYVTSHIEPAEDHENAHAIPGHPEGEKS